MAINPNPPVEAESKIVRAIALADILMYATKVLGEDLTTTPDDNDDRRRYVESIMREWSTTWSNGTRDGLTDLFTEEDTATVLAAELYGDTGESYDIREWVSAHLVALGF